MRWRGALGPVAVIVSMVPATAHGEAVETTGSVVCTTVPGDVELTNGNHPNAMVEVFRERGPKQLTVDVWVDHTTEGVFDTFGSTASESLPAGTWVTSYLIHYDPPEANEGEVVMGTIHFDGEILALITNHETLMDSDGVLGIPGASYERGGGLRSGDVGDMDTVQWSGSDVTVRFRSLGVMDEVRVVLAAEPAPDGGVDAAPDGASAVVDGSTDPPTSFRGSGGCACDVHRAPGSQLVAPAVLGILFFWRARRRRS